MLTKKHHILIITLLITCITPLALAQGYPEPQDDYVNDFAGILTQPDAAAIRQQLENLRQQTGIHMVVVTIDSYGSYGTSDATFENFATSLFNTWGIGQARNNSGVLILVAVEDRMCRIEMGAGYENYYDQPMKEVIDTSMIPYFKANDYSRGTFEGVRGAIDTLTNYEEPSWIEKYWPQLVVMILIGVCIFAGISCIRNGRKGWGFAFFAMAGVLLFFLLRSSGRGSSGFGGGTSFGGGASGSW